MRVELSLSTLALGIAVLLGIGCAGLPTLEKNRKPATSDRSFTELPFLKKIPTVFAPDWMTVGFGSLWAPMGGILVRIDGKTGTVLAEIPIGRGAYRGAVASAKSVWTANCVDQTLSEVSPATNSLIRTIAVPLGSDSEGSFAVSGGRIWVGTYEDSRDYLSVYDEESGARLARISLKDPANGVVALGHSIWVSHAVAGTVGRYDRDDFRKIAEIPVGSRPRFITAGFSSVWTLNQGEGTISRIDPERNALAASIAAKLAGSGGDLFADEHSVWATLDGVRWFESIRRRTRSRAVTSVATVPTLSVRARIDFGFRTVPRTRFG